MFHPGSWSTLHWTPASRAFFSQANPGLGLSQDSETLQSVFFNPIFSYFHLQVLQGTFSAVGHTFHSVFFCLGQRTARKERTCVHFLIWSWSCSKENNTLRYQYRESENLNASICQDLGCESLWVRHGRHGSPPRQFFLWAFAWKVCFLWEQRKTSKLSVNHTPTPTTQLYCN